MTISAILIVNNKMTPAISGTDHIKVLERALAPLTDAQKKLVRTELRPFVEGTAVVNQNGSLFDRSFGDFGLIVLEGALV